MFNVVKKIYPTPKSLFLVKIFKAYIIVFGVNLIFLSIYLCLSEYCSFKDQVLITSKQILNDLHDNIIIDFTLPDFVELQRKINQASKRNDIMFIVIVDQNNREILSSYNKRPTTKERIIKQVVTPNGKIGEIHLFYNHTHLANKYIKETLLLVSGFFIIFILGSSIIFMLTRTFLKPVNSILRAIDNFSAGDLKKRIVVNSNDEFETISTSLNNMADKILEANKIKDEFLSNTSHELRTPLNGIICITESLIDGIAGNLPQTAYSNLNVIRSSAKRLFVLINDILDAQKLKYKDIVLEKKPLDLRQMIRIVLDLSSHLADSKNVSFQTLIPDDIPSVLADENRLHQILQNLITNAAKFTETGTISITAKISGDFVETSVSDTGIGIPEEKLSDIFKPFEQIDSSTTRKYPGTGLGLSITKSLVESHGGQIRVTSKEGKGSTFTFSLPIVWETAQNAPHTATRNHFAKNRFLSDADNILIHHTRINGHYNKILVVDDDFISLQATVNNLYLNGYNANGKSSGKDALITINSHKPDLVLLDVMMPNMDGFEVCENIRKQYSLQQLPVIFITAKNRASDLLNGFNSGGNDYISKPFSKEELISRVRLHLSLKTSNERLILLREFSNDIGHIWNIENLGKMTCQVLEKDKYISGVAMFFENTPIYKSKDLNNLVLKEFRNWDKINSSIIQTENQVAIFTKIDGLNAYSFAVNTTIHENSDNDVEFIRNIFGQIKRLIESNFQLVSDSKKLNAIHFISINLKTITHIKADGNYSIAYQNGFDGQQLDMSIGSIQLFFDENKLTPIHRSYLVNPKKISYIGRNEIFLNKIKLPIGKKYINKVKERLKN